MQSAVARRYGRALFEVAQKAGKTEKILQQFSEVVQTLEQRADLYKLLKSPILTVRQKQELVQEIWSGRIDKELSQLFNLVISKQRESQLHGIFAEFERNVDEASGIVEVDVTSAVELQADLKEQIVAKLESWLGKQVRLKLATKPDLLAGLRIQIGDLRIDGSLNARLQQLYAAIKGKESSSKGVTFS